jgi:cell envelope opacity-associated protein A
MKSEQDVTKKLQADGYSDITGVKQDKNGYTASAMKNGKRVKIEIDANGNIQSMN